MHRAALMLFLVGSAAMAAAVAAPNDPAPGATGERPGASPAAQNKPFTYGLCSGPSNAEAFPSTPVPVVNEQCDYSQEFKSVSPDANYGGACGGYTTAFGVLGDLKRNWKQRRLLARWVAEPLTAATCSSARIAAAAWGYRCDNASCSSGAWERIGKPTARKGVWNAQSKTCSVNVDFSAAQKDWQTLNIDAIATLTQGGQAVRQRVGATIRATRPNAQCPTATQTPSSADPPPQVASQVNIQKRYPQ